MQIQGHSAKFVILDDAKPVFVLPQPLTFTEDVLLKSSLGSWGGLPIIAIGKKGGKIVGYKADGKPIYAGSSAAKKLAKKHEAEESGKSGLGAVALVKIKQWLSALGIAGKVLPGKGNQPTVVTMAAEAAEMITHHFGVEPKVANSSTAVFDAKDLQKFVGKPFTPKGKDEAAHFQAKAASGDLDEDPFPPMSELKWSKTLKSGQHSVDLYEGPGGKKFVFKFDNPTISRAEEAAARLGRLIVGPGRAAAAKHVQIGGKPGVLLEYLEGQIFNDSNHSNPPNPVVKKHLPEILEQQVVDWIVSNHDSHAGNFLVTPSGHVAGIDKGQAWKFLGSDKLDTNYSPNASDQIYIKVWNMWAGGQLKKWSEDDVIKAYGKALDNAEKISKDQFKSIVAPYIQEVVKMYHKDGAKVEAQMWARLQGARADFEKFLEARFGHPVTIPKEGEDNFDTMPDSEPGAPKTVSGTSVAPPAPVNDAGEPVTAPGWPLTKGNKTIVHPGDAVDPKVKWPKGYPGPGFKLELEYKGKQFAVEFGVQSTSKEDKHKSTVFYPDGTFKSFDSPNAASDSMVLFQKGLSLDLTGTEKKKLGISYPATKAFGLKAFQAELEAAHTVDDEQLEEMFSPPPEAVPEPEPVPKLVPYEEPIEGAWTSSTKKPTMQEVLDYPPGTEIEWVGKDGNTYTVTKQSDGGAWKTFTNENDLGPTNHAALVESLEHTDKFKIKLAAEKPPTPPVTVPPPPAKVKFSKPVGIGDLSVLPEGTVVDAPAAGDNLFSFEKKEGGWVLEGTTSTASPTDIAMLLNKYDGGTFKKPAPVPEPAVVHAPTIPEGFEPLTSGPSVSTVLEYPPGTEIHMVDGDGDEWKYTKTSSDHWDVAKNGFDKGYTISSNTVSANIDFDYVESAAVSVPKSAAEAAAKPSADNWETMPESTNEDTWQDWLEEAPIGTKYKWPSSVDPTTFWTAYKGSKSTFTVTSPKGKTLIKFLNALSVQLAVAVEDDNAEVQKLDPVPEALSPEPQVVAPPPVSGKWESAPKYPQSGTWQDVLEVDPVGTKYRWFNLGGYAFWQAIKVSPNVYELTIPAGHTFFINSEKLSAKLFAGQSHSVVQKMKPPAAPAESAPNWETMPDLKDKTHIDMVTMVEDMPAGTQLKWDASSEIQKLATKMLDGTWDVVNVATGHKVTRSKGWVGKVLKGSITPPKVAYPEGTKPAATPETKDEGWDELVNAILKPEYGDLVAWQNKVGPKRFAVMDENSNLWNVYDEDGNIVSQLHNSDLVEWLNTKANKESIDLYNVGQAAVAKKQGTLPKVIPEGVAPAPKVDSVAAGMTTPPKAKTDAASPLPIGCVKAVQKKFQLGGTKVKKEVVLHALEGGKFKVDMPDGSSPEFASLSAASDHVWVNQKGYESVAQYKEQTGKTKIASGGGWKFWGINPAAITAPPVPAEAPEPPGQPKPSEINWKTANIGKGDDHAWMLKQLEKQPAGGQVKIINHDTGVVNIWTKGPTGWTTPSLGSLNLQSDALLAIADDDPSKLHPDWDWQFPEGTKLDPMPGEGPITGTHIYKWGEIEANVLDKLGDFPIGTIITYEDDKDQAVYNAKLVLTDEGAIGVQFKDQGSADWSKKAPVSILLDGLTTDIAPGSSVEVEFPDGADILEGQKPLNAIPAPELMDKWPVGTKFGWNVSGTPSGYHKVEFEKKPDGWYVGYDGLDKIPVGPSSVKTAWNYEDGSSWYKEGVSEANWETMPAFGEAKASAVSKMYVAPIGTSAKMVVPGIGDPDAAWTVTKVSGSKWQDHEGKSYSPSDFLAHADETDEVQIKYPAKSGAPTKVEGPKPEAPAGNKNFPIDEVAKMVDLHVLDAGNTVMLSHALDGKVHTYTLMPDGTYQDSVMGHGPKTVTGQELIQTLKNHAEKDIGVDVHTQHDMAEWEEIDTAVGVSIATANDAPIGAKFKYADEDDDLILATKVGENKWTVQNLDSPDTEPEEDTPDVVIYHALKESMQLHDFEPAYQVSGGEVVTYQPTTVQVALENSDIAKKHGAKFQITPSKKAGHTNIKLKVDSSTSQSELLELAEQFGFKDKITNQKGSPVYSYGGYYITVPTAALEMQTAMPLKPGETPPAPKAKLSTPKPKPKPKELSAEEKAKIEKAKKTAEWLKTTTPVSGAKATMVLSYLQAFAQKDAADLKMWARKDENGKIILGSPHGHFPEVLKALEAEGLKTTPVETPLGTFYQVTSVQALAKAIPGQPANFITGPDGKSYPKGTTFGEKKIETPIKELLKGEPGFHKIKPHKTNDKLSVLKVAGSGEEQKQQLEAMLKKYSLKHGTIISGSSNTLVEVENVELDSVGHVETVIEPTVPEMPKFFSSAPYPTMGVAKAGQEGVNNRADLGAVAALSIGKFGHAIRMGSAGVFKNGQVYARKVKDKSGKEFFEVSGIFNQLPGGDGLDKFGSIALPTAMTSGTGKFKLHSFAGGIHNESGPGSGTIMKSPGWTGKTGGGSQVDLFADGAPQAFRNTFKVRIPADKDVESEMAEAFGAMGISVDAAMAEQTEEDERLLKKAAILKAMIGPKAWCTESVALPPKRLNDEGWLDARLASHGVTEEMVASARFETTFENHQSVVFDDPKVDDSPNIKFVYQGNSFEGIFYQILDGSGWSSRSARYLNGIEQGGASAADDVATGGATGAFARIGKTGAKGGWGLKCEGWKVVFHPRILKRADWRFYTSDSFGRITGDGSFQPGAGKERHGVTGSMSSSNEVLFDQGMSVKDVAGILAPSAGDRQKMLDQLAKEGITELNGIPMADIVKVQPSSHRDKCASVFPALKSGVMP